MRRGRYPSKHSEMKALSPQTSSLPEPIARSVRAKHVPPTLIACSLNGTSLRAFSMDPFLVLGYIQWDVDPVAFEIAGRGVRWYGLLFALGFFIGFTIMRRVFRREERPEKDLDFLLYWLLGGTVVGARLGHTLFYDPGFYLSNPIEILKVYEGGLASHGGFIGVLTAIYLYSRSREDQPFLWVLDRIAVPTALVGSLIRLGNLFNSEILGTETTVPWAFVFELRDAVPRHPAQLYESLAYLAVFGVLWHVYQKRGPDVARGLLSGLFMVLIFGARFLIEFLKPEQAHFAVGLPLTMGQILSIPVLAIGGYLLWQARRQKRVES